MQLSGGGGSAVAITGYQGVYEGAAVPHTGGRVGPAAGTHNAFGNFRINGPANPSSIQQVTIDSGTFPLVPSVNASVGNLVSVYSVLNRGDVAGLQHPGYSQDSRYGVQISPDGLPQMPTTRNPFAQQDRLQLPASSNAGADGRTLLQHVPTGPRSHTTSGPLRQALLRPAQRNGSQAAAGMNDLSRGATLPANIQPHSLGRDFGSNQGYRAPHRGRGGFGSGYGGVQQGSAQIQSGLGGYGRGFTGQHYLPATQAGTGGHRAAGEVSMHDPRPQHIQETGHRRTHGRRGGRGKDGKVADSEYAKYLDQLNDESRRNGENLLMGDRFSGHAYLQRQIRPSEDVGCEFNPPTPVMAPATGHALPANPGLLAAPSGLFALNMLPSVPLAGSSLTVPRASSTIPSPAPFAASDFDNLVFGQEAGTVTPHHPFLRKTSRFFGKKDNEEEEAERR